MTLEAEKAALDADQRIFDQKVEAMLATVEAKTQQIQNLSSQQVALQEETKRLKDLNDQLRRSVDAARQQADAQAEQHRQERVQLEERAMAQERRLLIDLDQARQAMKRAQKALTDEQHKHKASTASQTQRLAEQQAQLVQYYALRDQLERELTTTKATLLAADSRIEELQRNTSLQLNALSRKIDRGLAPRPKINQVRVRNARASLQPSLVRRK
jgi:chromosome segregation ATPase